MMCFFDTLDHGWMMRFLEHRIADRRILRLIRKWLSAGTIENGIRTAAQVGTPQGAVICQRRNKNPPAGRRKTRPVCGVVELALPL